MTSTPGTYRLTVNALNSDIVDTANNAFSSSHTEPWALDTTSPLADVVDVAPDPRQAAVGALNVLLTEKLSAASESAVIANPETHFALAYDDGTSATAGNVAGAAFATPIVITSAGHGLSDGDEITIFGVLGNTNANGVFVVTNATASTFELFDLGGSPVNGNAAYTSGGRWVRNVNLTGMPVTQETDIRYVFNLAGLTGTAGTYRFSLLANSGLTDIAGNSFTPAAGRFNVSAQDDWTYGPDVPPSGTIALGFVSPIGTNAGVVQINFSEPLEKTISGSSVVDLTDFTLTRLGTGATNLLAAQPSSILQQTGPTTFTLDLSGAGLTDVNDTYVLRLLTNPLSTSATPIKDLTGNPLTNDSDLATPAGVASQVTWVKNSSGPQVSGISGVFTDPAVDGMRTTTPAIDTLTATKLRAAGTLTINFSQIVTGINLTDASQNFRLTRQGVPVSLEGVAVTQITGSQYRINLTALTGTDGNYLFTVLGDGQIQNGSSVPLLNNKSVAWTKNGTITVNQTSDAGDLTTLGNEIIDSNTSTAGFQIPLRGAIREANALLGDDVIDLGIGTYTLTLGGIQEDFAVSGDLDIRENLTIRGKGVGQTIIDASGLPAAQPGSHLPSPGRCHSEPLRRHAANRRRSRQRRRRRDSQFRHGQPPRFGNQKQHIARRRWRDQQRGHHDDRSDCDQRQHLDQRGGWNPQLGHSDDHEQHAVGQPNHQHSRRWVGQSRRWNRDADQCHGLDQHVKHRCRRRPPQ